MQILTHPAQLQRLEGILRKSLPLALPVFGAVLNINRGNPGQFEVLVDKWPEFSAVLARPSGEVASGDTGHSRGRRWHGALACGRCAQSTRGCPQVPVNDGYWNTQAAPAPGVRVGSLQPSHVDLLNNTWPYGGNARSRRYLAEILGRFPQVCLQDGSGEPVAWVLTDHFGTGTHSYTLPEQRRRGHMQVALTVAAQRAQARGFPTFG
ncbi:GLYL3 protein, partial [Aphelocoma coerulescens]|nr:GLYL3 protein [Aphelocoma coerulescens]